MHRCRGRARLAPHRAGWRAGLVVILIASSCGGGGPAEPTSTSSIPAATTTVAAAFEAEYRLSFEASWSVATHPQDFPPDPHFSGIIGGTHRMGYRLFEPGTIASDGIEAMAERGSKSPLDAALMRAIAAGSVEQIVSADGVALSPGSVSAVFRVSQDFPSLSITLMLAPSPDWFVGLNAVSLFEDGQWVESLTIEALPYDAGTDSGRSYASADRDTNPRQPIALVSQGPLVVGGATPPVGRFRIDRQ